MKKGWEEYIIKLIEKGEVLIKFENGKGEVRVRQPAQNKQKK